MRRKGESDRERERERDVRCISIHTFEGLKRRRLESKLLVDNMNSRDENGSFDQHSWNVNNRSKEQRNFWTSTLRNVDFFSFTFHYDPPPQSATPPRQRDVSDKRTPRNNNFTLPKTEKPDKIETLDTEEKSPQTPPEPSITNSQNTWLLNLKKKFNLSRRNSAVSSSSFSFKANTICASLTSSPSSVISYSKSPPPTKPIEIVNSYVRTVPKKATNETIVIKSQSALPTRKLQQNHVVFSSSSSSSSSLPTPSTSSFSSSSAALTKQRLLSSTSSAASSSLSVSSSFCHPNKNNTEQPQIQSKCRKRK